MGGHQTFEPLTQPPAAGADACEKLLVVDDLDHRVADRHRQRVAGIGRAVGACGHGRARLGGREHRAEGKAAADALGDHHDVGFDPGPFMGEEPPRPPDAALHLVEDQKRAGLVAEIAQTFQADVGHDADSALALDRLDDDGGDVVGQRGAQRVVIAPGQLGETRQQRSEAVDQFLRACRRDGRGRTPVKRAFEGEDTVAVAALRGPVLARHLDSQFAGLGARVGEGHVVGEGRRRQAFGQTLLPRHAVEVRQMPDVLGLGLQRLDQLGMGVAERVHRDPGPEIKPSPAVLVPEPGALSLDEGHGRAGVERQKRGIGHGDHLGARGCRSGSDAGRARPGRARAVSVGVEACGHSRSCRRHARCAPVAQEKRAPEGERPFRGRVRDLGKPDVSLNGRSWSCPRSRRWSCRPDRRHRSRRT